MSPLRPRTGEATRIALLVLVAFVGASLTPDPTRAGSDSDAPFRVMERSLRELPDDPKVMSQLPTDRPFFLATGHTTDITTNAAEVLSGSGGMNPYKYGSLGVVEPGAYADVILVDGNPLEDITRIKRDHVDLVMKDGVIYKNEL